MYELLYIFFKVKHLFNLNGLWQDARARFHRLVSPSCISFLYIILETFSLWGKKLENVNFAQVKDVYSHVYVFCIPNEVISAIHID